jgi:hypothetical protein
VYFTVLYQHTATVIVCMYGVLWSQSGVLWSLSGVLRSLSGVCVEFEWSKFTKGVSTNIQ